jgi:hypothetical protein
MPPKREDRKEQLQLSPQTQAIIDTLEKEGKLLRTDGRTHSLKNIRADLAKFDGVFNRIATALDGQKEYFDKMGDMNRELIEQQKNEEALAEVQTAAAAEPVEPVRQDTSRETEKEKKEGGGLTGLLGSIIPSGKMMKNLAMAGGGMFLAYNFVKGMIDEKSGGAFTAFEDSMIETFKSVNWDEVGSSFVQFAEKVPEALTAITEFIKSPAGVLLGVGAAGLGADLLTGGIARGATSGLVGGLLRRGPGPQTTVPQAAVDPDGNPTKNKMKGIGVGSALLAAAGVGVMAYGDEIAEFIAAEAAGMSPEEIAASEVVDTGGVLAAAAGGALTFGALFGPTGALAGLIIGGAVGITRKVAEVIGRSNEEATQQAIAEETAKLQQQAQDREQNEENARQAQELLDEYARTGKEMSDELRASLEKQAAYKFEEIDNSELIASTNQEIGEQLAKAEQLLANRQKSGPSFRVAMPGGGFVEEEDLRAEEITEIKAKFDARNAELEAEIAAIQQIIQNRIAESAGALTQEDFTYVAPEGFWESIKDIWQNSADRLRDRAERAAEKEAIQANMDQITAAGIGYGGITYVDSSSAVGGTTVQNINASKGATTSIAASSVGGGAIGGRSRKALLLAAGSD